MRAHLAIVAAAMLLTGCGGAHEVEVQRTATDWAEAVDSGDWGAACALLAPSTLTRLEQSARKQCAEALPDEATDPVGEPRLETFGKAGEVTWDGETLFVADFSGRWLVWAASCTPTGDDRPYSCRISGG